MPYSYRINGDKATVYKKDTGEVVGHTTKGKLKSYLAALYSAEGRTKRKRSIVGPARMN